MYYGTWNPARRTMLSGSEGPPLVRWTVALFLSVSVTHLVWWTMVSGTKDHAIRFERRWHRFQGPCWVWKCAGTASGTPEASKDKPPPAPAKRASPHHLPTSGFQPYRPDDRFVFGFLLLWYLCSSSSKLQITQYSNPRRQSCSIVTLATTMERGREKIKCVTSQNVDLHQSFSFGNCASMKAFFETGGIWNAAHEHSSSWFLMVWM